MRHKYIYMVREALEIFQHEYAILSADMLNV